MAIILEENKKQVSWLFVISIILAFILVGLAVYYVFFKTPELFDKIILPKELEATKKFRNANVDISGIINDPVFKSLHTYVSDPLPGRIGRINPFTSF